MPGQEGQGEIKGNHRRKSKDSQVMPERMRERCKMIGDQEIRGEMQIESQRRRGKEVGRITAAMYITRR